MPERATSTPAPSTHNRATSGSESHADAQTNGSTSPSSFAGHGSAVPLRTDSNAASDRNAQNVATGGTGPSVLRVNRNACATQTVITYREYVTHRTSPRDLAHEIIARSLARDDADGLRTAGVPPVPLPLGVSSPYAHNQNSKTPAGGQRYENPASPYASPTLNNSVILSAAKDPNFASSSASPRATGSPYAYASQSTPHTQEKIDAIYLSPDAFARRTDEASIADQMGDVFAAAGFPRPIPADNDRIGGWMLMYQMLDANEWLLTDNCIELIRTIPTLVRDMARIEDIEKMDGDDPADAARYGLKSRYATRAAYSIEHLPYEARLAARVLSADPTVRAIQARKAQLEERGRTQLRPTPPPLVVVFAVRTAGVPPALLTLPFNVAHLFRGEDFPIFALRQFTL